MAKRVGEPTPSSIVRTPRQRRQWVVVSYDITDDKRRTQVMKTLEGYGSRVQFSVFECELRPADLEQLKARLRAIIQKETDDVRFYQLCEGCLAKITTMGQARVYRQTAYRVVGS